MLNDLHARGSSVLKKSNQSATSVIRGSIYLQTDLSIVEIDLKPLLAGQSPVYKQVFSAQTVEELNRFQVSSRFMAVFSSKDDVLSLSNTKSVLLIPEPSKYHITKMSPLLEKAEEIDKKNKLNGGMKSQHYLSVHQMFIEDG